MLAKDVTVFSKTFEKGTTFQFTTSWKPTLDEFRAALEHSFVVEKMFSNNDMAIAVISQLQ